MDGLLVIDKPPGPTSHDVVARVRQVLHERRAGHTGTLDPAASGVLALVLGRATRLAQFLTGSQKAYDATIRLGVATDTYDSLGRAAGAPYTGSLPSRIEIDRALDAFRGTFVQRPPAFSAKKVDGRRSYKTARAAARARLEDANAAEERLEPGLPAPVPVTAYSIDLVAVEGDRVMVQLACSSGFYVRSLAHDLGERLRTGAHLEALRRTRSGDAQLADALPLAAVERDPAAAVRALVPLAALLPSFDAIVLTAAGVRRAMNGCEIGRADFIRGGAGSPLLRLLDASGDLVGIAEPGSTPGYFHPRVILV
jgi:tRNA pseudouridine55 synthase